MHSLSGSVETSVESGIALVTISSESRRNAVSAAMWAELARTAKYLATLPEVRVVVIRGRGDVSFSAGADISEFAERRQSAEQSEEYAVLCEGATGAIAALPVPVIALIHGFCLGAGTAIALSCDIRYVDDRAKVGIPAARLGVGYELSWVRRLVDICGPTEASQLLFSARQFDAQSALRMRFASAVLPAGELDAFVAAMARDMVHNAPLTVRAAKVAIKASLTDQKLDWTAAARSVRTCAESQDYLRAIEAYAQRQVPVFEGN